MRLLPWRKDLKRCQLKTTFAATTTITSTQAMTSTNKKIVFKAGSNASLFIPNATSVGSYPAPILAFSLVRARIRAFCKLRKAAKRGPRFCVAPKFVLRSRKSDAHTDNFVSKPIRELDNENVWLACLKMFKFFHSSIFERVYWGPSAQLRRIFLDSDEPRWLKNPNLSFSKSCHSPKSKMSFRLIVTNCDCSWRSRNAVIITTRK